MPRRPEISERDRIVGLIQGVEVLVEKLRQEDIELSLLDRYEKALWRAHTHNLLRVHRIVQAANGGDNGTAT